MAFPSKTLDPEQVANQEPLRKGDKLSTMFPHSVLAVIGKHCPGIRERPTEDPRLHACRISFEISCLSSSSLKNTMPARLIFYYCLSESQPLTNCVWNMSGQSLPWWEKLDKMIGIMRGNWEIPLWKDQGRKR